MSSGDKTSGGMKAFGELVKFLREQRHLTQDKLAVRSDLSQSEVSRIENATFAREPNEETIRKIAKGLEIEPEDLVRTTPLASLFGQSGIVSIGSVNQGPPIVAYFASALTNLNSLQRDEIKALDEKVDDICRQYERYPLVLYRPRKTTSPWDNPEASAREVYDIDQERVATSDLLILAAIFPSLGAGMELQLALQSCSRVVLLTKKGSPLSRMVIGCPARMEIVEYEELDELETAIPDALHELIPLIAEFRFGLSSDQSPQRDTDVGGRIEQLRRNRGLSPADLARMVGVDAAYIESIESKPEQVTNPSLEILKRIARALSADEAFLITGHKIPIQEHNRFFADHFRSLRLYATESRMQMNEFEELWKGHVDRYELEFSAPGADRRIEVGDRKYWISRHESLKKDNAKGLFQTTKHSKS